MKLVVCNIFLILCFLQNGCDEKLYSLITVSPKETYRIQLTETRTEVSPQNIWPYKVFLEIRKNGQEIVRNERLYVGDEEDLRFGAIAPAAEWISEKVLRLGSEKSATEERHDWIEFYNNSGKILTYVLISGKTAKPGEKFLLFDVMPGERIRVQALAQTDEGRDASGIGCFGRFDDGSVRDTVIRSFDVRGKYKSPSHYFITLNSDTTRIESQEYQPIK